MTIEIKPRRAVARTIARGPAGSPGQPPVPSRRDSDNHLIFTMPDESVIDTGNWTGQEGPVTSLSIGGTGLPAGRLSFSATDPAPATDYTGSSAATLRYVDCGGGVVPIWDNTSNAWFWRSFSGSLALALDSDSGHTLYHAADTVFDVYVIWDSDLGSLRLATSGAAGRDFSQRGSNISGLTLKNGIYVNSIDANLRVNNTGDTATVDYLQPGVNQATYVGSIRTVAAGQGEDSFLRRRVYNAYNPRRRISRQKFTGSAYAYTTADWRQVAGDAAMQADMVIGLQGHLVSVKAIHFAAITSGTHPILFNTGAGYNTGGSTTRLSSNESMGSYGRIMDEVGAFPSDMDWVGYMGPGAFEFPWQEYGGVGVQFQTNSEFLRNGIIVKANI